MSKSKKFKLDCQHPPRKYTNKLNVFKFGYLPMDSWWKFWHNLLPNVGNFFWTIRAAWQRAVKGWCNWDIFDLDITYYHYLIATLTTFRNRAVGYPDTLFPTFEDYIAKLDELIDTIIELSYPPDENTESPFDWSINKKPSKEEKEKYFNELKEAYRYHDEKLQETLAEIGKYLPSLWL